MRRSQPLSPSTPGPADPDGRELALRALRSRDLSVGELERRLAERGVAPEDAAATVDALVRTGLVDDARLAHRRAAVLAERGEGDALIRHRLCGLRLDAELVEDAIASLEPESDRAMRVAERRGRGPQALRHLARKGFSPESVERVVATRNVRELG